MTCAEQSRAVQNMVRWRSSLLMRCILPQGRHEQHANQFMSEWLVQKQQLQEMAA